MNNVFGVFDSAFVLNRDLDSDRMHRVATRLAALGVPFERFDATLPPEPRQFKKNESITPGAHACAQSHAALLRTVLERGQDRILILEDDVVFRDDTNEYMARIAPSLNIIEWDIFYLGLHLRRATGRLTKHIGRVGLGFHSHAYAVTRAAIPRLLSYIDSVLSDPVTTFDVYNDPHLVKLYSIPILAVQEPNISSITNERIDRLPQYFSTFDGEDYERNCSEMQQWSSKWRDILGFLEDLDTAKKTFAGGPLEIAIRQFRNALDSWPAVRQMLLTEQRFRPVFDRLISGDTDDEQGQLQACAEMTEILGRKFRHYL